MSVGRMAGFGYVIFLIGYAWYKYLVAMPAEFSTAYLQSVVILVLLTGVAPFFLSFGGVKLFGVRGLGGSAIGLLLGLLLCVAGYAAYWWFFLAPQGGAPAVYDVAPRGIGWGLLQGGLAAVAANHR